MSEGNDTRRPSSQGGSGSRGALEAALLDQCARWRRGERVLAEIYLAEHTGLRADAEAALDLVANEILLRRERGERVELEEYLRRFPEWAAQIRDQFEVERAIEGTSPGATWSPEAETGPEFNPGQAGEQAALPAIPGYDILDVLGRGGMGVVFRARQAGLGRLVALKMIPPGAYAGPEELARFRREAEAVARFRHPNIVQIHEVGESDGRPFFSLELVEGGTLAEKVRGTPQPARKAAELVEALARAVHLAHQQGIVHRDLKPANVLLAEDGTPKITDFGLAKRLEGGSAHTQTGAIVGTPSYMAPEQARGLTRQVGPPVDVYGLGAILYECLTGRPPFQGETAGDVMIQVLNEDPVPPRRLQPKCPRDLETICLKCLCKPPSERYASAQALADDLRRFLAGEPIHARPASAWERGRKWARRRPAAAALVVVSVAAVVTVATLIGVGNARLVEQRNLAEGKRKEAEANAEAADAQRRRAVAHLRRAREAVERMLTRVGHDRLAPAPYTMKVREELLGDAVQLYQEMAQEEESDLEILYEVGRSLRRLGQLQAGRGQRQQAEQSYRRAVQVFEKLTALDPNQPAHRKELAASCNNLSTALDPNNNADAEPLLRRALAMQEKLAEDHPKDPDYLLDALVTKGNLGDLYYLQKRTEPALQYWKESIAGLERLAAAAPKEREYHFRLAAGLLNQGSYLARLGRLEEAEPIFRRAVAAFEPLADGPTADLGSRGRLAMSCFNLGLLLSSRGNASEGERHLRRAAEVRRKMTREHPEVARYHADLGAILHRLGYVVRGQGDVAAAIRTWEDGIEHHRAALKATPEDANTQWLLGLDCWNVADGHLRLGDHRKAAEAAAGLPPDNRIVWETQARGAFLLARCSAVAAKDMSLPADGRQARAREYADQAVVLLRQAVGKGYQDLPYLQKEPALDVLRPRADFQRLLAMLAARKKDG